MKFQPYVSIIINNYNYDRFLSEAINSAINQTYPHTEVIVVDDGSTDNSRDIISGYGDRIIPIFKENSGQGSAFNAGFAASRGEIFCLLDADDVWLSQKVEYVVEAFSQFRNASVVYHKVQNVGKTGTPIGRPWPHQLVRGNIAKKLAKTGGWWPFSPSTGLSFSRNFLLQVMNIPENEYRICADTYLADLAPFFGDVVGIKQVLSLFRIHGYNNWSHPIDAQRRSVKYHELRVNVLNSVLKHLGFGVEVSLSENLAYRTTKYKLGEEDDLIGLILLTVCNPYDWRLHSRIKAAVKLWLEGNFKKSRN
ncbi:glycosyltransferase family 2 protein [Anabaena sp. CCY 0017]|uniref:glycosyltransferase family 2 protein n=1 Tax=Anabaena sp. CCY 0017 TaxID=3103866 RepID=UPI0039C6B6B0